jgi:hypothetical protein
VERGLQAQTSEKGPTGVGGWLLFFCFGQVVLAPNNAIRHITHLWETLGPHPFPVQRQIATIDTSISVIVAAYGFVIGILLWKRHRRGKSLARQYLVIRMLVSITYFTLAVAWAYHSFPVLGHKMMFSAVPTTVLEVAVIILWLLYFTYSKRVMNTFPSQISQPAQV